MVPALLQASAEEHPLRIFGVTLLGVTTATLTKLLLSAGAIIALLLISSGIRHVLRLILSDARHEPVHFWAGQVTRIVSVTLIVLALVSIWFEDSSRLGTVIGLLSAGVAIALQRVITAFAAYIIILRGRIFSVGHRIMIGGVRGDVIALGFMQTTVMEMGQAPGEQEDNPSMWVNARQYSGRLVRVTNDKIFDSPVYNYTKEFPFLWEEMHLPIGYGADRQRAEQILLEVAERHTRPICDRAMPALRALRDRYRTLAEVELAPRVYQRLTDNWIELSLRFVSDVHGARTLKDAMSRDILGELEASRIQVASATFEVVGLPPIRIETAGATRP